MRQELENLERGDAVEKWDTLWMEWQEYEFLRWSEERFTVLGKRLADDREEWISISQLRITGRKVEHQQPLQEDKPKKKGWTLFDDPVPEHLIKKKKGSRKL